VTRVYLLLGSNIDPAQSLSRAVAMLKEQVTVVGVSPVFESPPVGDLQQPCFLNAAVAIETSLSPSGLRNRVLKPIEAALGRVRTGNKYSPRTIDLDILLFGDRVLVCGGKRIPDPDLLRRPHAACPMAALAPELRHPETGQTMSAIAAALDHQAVRMLPEITIAGAMRVTEDGHYASGDQSCRV